MTPGIYDMPAEDYFKKHGLNKSGAVDFAKSPAYYQYRLQSPSLPTPAMARGSHLHMRVLEPDLWKKTYVADPKMPKRSKKDKEAWQEWQQSHEGMIIVPQEEVDDIGRMANALFRSETASALLSDGKAEQSIFWNDPAHGFVCKCRVDYLNPIYKSIIDVKTTSDLAALERSVSTYRYHWQAYHYSAGLEVVAPGEYEAFIFIFIETKPPHEVVIRALDRDSLMIAEAEMEPIREAYAECLKTDMWPRPSDEIQELSLPRWHKSQAIFA